MAAAGMTLFGKSQWNQVKGSIEAFLTLRKERVVLVGPRVLFSR